MKKGAKKWIAFDFDISINSKKFPDTNSKAVEFIDAPKNVDCTDSNAVITSRNGSKMNFNFLEKLKPKTVEDLAVHSKKIKEVELWLEQNVTARNKPFSSILLLTGPTGSGKTATVNVLCKTMDIKVTEWVNPMDQDYETGQTQTVRFLDFFTQSKYTSLCDNFNSRKITLVEDFPNLVTYNPSEFTEVIAKCHSGSSAVIFICTDASNSKLDLSQTLFPQEIREKYGITSISFNACSATLLKNALRRAHNLIQAHPDIFRTPSSDVVEAIITTSMGDIRCAVNQYHFAALKGATDIPTVIKPSKTRGAKRKRNEKSAASVKSMAKDETLGFFHGLGRVLNPKRQELSNSWRLQCDFDALIDQFSTQPSTFNAFLQENYLKYFGDLGDAQKAADILSQAQLFLERWTDRQDTLVYALWVAVLGLMVFNEHKVSKWNQIKGPTKLKREIDSNLETRTIRRTECLYYNIITNDNRFHVFKS